jgi:hypothetical protein
LKKGGSYEEKKDYIYYFLDNNIHILSDQYLTKTVKKQFTGSEV